jgi:hypothetical protein
MWFAEQLNSFLNLDHVKEYPNMARAKATSGKANRTNTNTSKEQLGVNNPSGVPEVNAVAAADAVPTDIQQESKITPETKPEPKLENKLEKKIFEVRKPELRKNVVPINVEEEIRRRAFELYQQREPGSGSEAEDWLTAEREVMQRYRQQSA